MSAIVAIRLLLVICFVIAGFVAALVSPLSIALAPKIGAMDVPRDRRRMHEYTVPCLGGLAIFVAGSLMFLVIRFILGLYYLIDSSYASHPRQLMACLIGGVIIYAVGVYDDIKDMKPIIKLISQIVCASVTFALGVRIPAFAMLGINFPADSFMGVIISWLVTTVWIVVITNAINLTDGMDGLAAGVSGISAAAIAFSAYIHSQYTVAFAMIALAGACAGFLPFNFYPAKTFMGDGGALWLGFMISSISVIGPAKGATIVANIVPLLVLGVPILDMGFAILRRKVRGKGIFEADKGHLHHQLNKIGMGQRRSVLMIYGISAVMGVAAIVFSRGLYAEAILLLLVAVLFVVVLVWDWNKKGKN